MREGHPVLWTLDEHRADHLVVEYPYFETAEPLIFDEPGTYVETSVAFAHNLIHRWTMASARL